LKQASGKVPPRHSKTAITLDAFRDALPQHNMVQEFIPFNTPLFLEQGIENIRTAYGHKHISGDGHFTLRCQTFFEELLGAKRVLLTTSCSDALELCALLIEAQAGDEIIVPAFTFVTSASAFALRGARPVFVDIRPDTFNIDEVLLERSITQRTKAAVVVHYAGVGCEMDAITQATTGRGVTLIEDNAHGLLGSFRGRPLGSFGDLATMSFHETKNLSCGEGGALAINDPRYVARAEILREKGTDRSRFFRGEVTKYSWIDIGSSFLPSDILAALLWSQIVERNRIQEKRQEIHFKYARGLNDWAISAGVRCTTIPENCISGYHLFALLMPDAAAQAGLIAHLRNLEIHAVFHYQPLHLTPMGRRLGGIPGQCPVAEFVAQRIVRLPFFFDLDAGNQERIIAAVLDFRV
jgi:dTDP-4-amino-4,6-dideoxygalactose transaminase